MKKKVRDFINYNKYFIQFIYALIVLNVLTLILESYKELNDNYGIFFYAFEIFFCSDFYFGISHSNLGFRQNERRQKKNELILRFLP